VFSPLLFASSYLSDIRLIIIYGSALSTIWTLSHP
jgi:hypothetical protein